MARLNLEIVRRKFPEAREVIGKNGVEFNTDCPFPHQKGGTYKFYINAETGTYYCQDCRRSGSAWTSFFESVLASRFGHLHILRDDPGTDRVQDHRQFFAAGSHGERWGKDGRVFAPGKTVSLSTLGAGHPAWDYLISRGLSPDEFANPDHAFHALYCIKGQVEVLKGEAKSQARIVYPVCDLQGEPVGWTARLIDKMEGEGDGARRFVWDGRHWNETFRMLSGKWSDHHIPKWLHLPSMPKSQILYNLDQAQHFLEVVAVEGIFDVHKIGAFAVGYFGDTPSRHQISILKTYFDRVIWMPDRGVDLTSPRAMEFMQSIREACRLDVVQGELYGDPGAAPRAYNLEQIRRAIEAP